MDRQVRDSLVLHSKLTRFQKIDKMTTAGLLAEKFPYKDSKEQKRFHTFQFAFATTIAHEITHLFGTFLGLGEVRTPPRKGSEEAKETAKDEQPREGGVYMEEAVFGGRVTFFKDPSDDESQISLSLIALVESPKFELIKIFRPVYHTF